MAPRSGRKTFRPATTPEGRENQLISLASDLAERQLRDGSASSQVLTHFLKMGTERERLERQKIQNENLLLSAKVDQINSSQRLEGLYDDALRAMSEYKGEAPTYDEDDDYYDGS